MEVAVPSPNMDYHFNGGRSKISTVPFPTTPKACGKYFYSAPSSPMRMSEFYRDFDELQSSQMDEPEMEDDDFAFDICQQLESTTLSADELFDDGKIRPLETPPQSPISQQNKIFQNAYSTERRKDPTEMKIKNTEGKKEQKRGRVRNSALSSSASRRTVRSLSPNRVSSSPWDEKQPLQNNVGKLKLIPGSPSATGTNSNATSSKGSRRWRLKDLFRSASEGRGTRKDPLRKYSTLYKKQEELKNTSFKSNNSRNGPVSTYEQHFSMNRAASEDMKKKTFLPYKAILGGLLFNPAVHMHTNYRSSR